MTFYAQCAAAWQRHQSMLCVGLDPDPARFPEPIRAAAPDDVLAQVEAFCRGIVEATAPHCCAFKPQIAYFAALGAEAVLERLGRWVRASYPDHLWILDSKRGDIGSTAERYATEAFGRYLAHAVTLSPYMGSDSLTPFFAHTGGGVFLLCRTSNPGGNDLQMLPLAGPDAGLRLFEKVAQQVAQRADWRGQDQAGLVVGATYPEELARVRALAPEAPLLVPGIGAQGGDLAAVLAAGRTADGGLLINASRSILYADGSAHWQTAAARAAQELAAAMQ